MDSIHCEIGFVLKCCWGYEHIVQTYIASCVRSTLHHISIVHVPFFPLPSSRSLSLIHSHSFYVPILFVSVFAMHSPTYEWMWNLWFGVKWRTKKTNQVKFVRRKTYWDDYFGFETRLGRGSSSSSSSINGHSCIVSQCLCLVIQCWRLEVMKSSSEQQSLSPFKLFRLITIPVCSVWERVSVCACGFVVRQNRNHWLSNRFSISRELFAKWRVPVCMLYVCVWCRVFFSFHFYLFCSDSFSYSSLTPFRCGTSFVDCRDCGCYSFVRLFVFCFSDFIESVRSI